MEGRSDGRFGWKVRMEGSDGRFRWKVPLAPCDERAWMHVSRHNPPTPKSKALAHYLYYRHLGIADGMSIGRVWACRYPPNRHAVGAAEMTRLFKTRTACPRPETFPPLPSDPSSCLGVRRRQAPRCLIESNAQSPITEHSLTLGEAAMSSGNVPTHHRLGAAKVFLPFFSLGVSVHARDACPRPQNLSDAALRIRRRASAFAVGVPPRRSF